MKNASSGVAISSKTTVLKGGRGGGVKPEIVCR